MLLKFSKSYAHQFLLLLLWSIVQSLLWFTIGPKIGADSDLYFTLAEELHRLEFPLNRTLLYSSYPLFILVSQTLFSGKFSVLFFHLLFNGLSILAFYSIIANTSENKKTALIGSIIYCLYLPLHEWNFIVYGESIFTSFTIFCIYFIVTKKYKLLSITLLITVFCRPTSLLFLLALFIGWAYQKYKNGNYSQRITLFLMGIISLTLGILFHQALEYYGPFMIEGYLIPEIIYFRNSLGVSPPINPYIPSEDDDIIIQLFLFVFNNWWYFLKITLIKGALFFGNIKPYYSLPHNLLIILSLYPLYYFAFKKCLKRARLKFIDIFCITYILLQGFTVSITSENWDGRFLIPIIPFIIYLSCFEIYNTLKKNRALITFVRYFTLH
ncbi:hypothetical protein [Flammeovirga sp. SubArs3]|uniref:hypothetical protein n=1 Tax=Flammeovirga sp. SubArs3 TaxID=2995316 RepID=UPI00248B55D9|nr:hypothetical protein [Flammeovirga sp. SubArs3]